MNHLILPKYREYKFLPLMHQNWLKMCLHTLLHNMYYI